MKHLFLLFALFSAMAAVAQTAHETAYSFMRSGDHDNAILVLNKAIQAEPDNEQLLQDLTLAYYYKKDFAQARTYAKKLTDLDNIDVTSFQIAGTVHRALEEVKEAEKLYKKALKKYPQSGVLYSEYGEMLWGKNDDNAIKMWEKGIEMAPAYPGNYYHAATYYHYTKDKVWPLLYGEIFVNMEYLTERATEVKKLLLNGYKEKLFLDKSGEADKKTSPFAKAVQETFQKQESLTGKGLTVETLTMIRTKFLLDWFAKYGEKYPFFLFDYQRQLVREGMFEAYNQWLFGPVENLASFDQWTKANGDTYKKFVAFQRNRVFKMPQGQYYGNNKDD
jgi:tetratricopeptide (TPR) repeat protein